jgi:hypothetical protein
MNWVGNAGVHTVFLIRFWRGPRSEFGKPIFQPVFAQSLLASGRARKQVQYGAQL